jgi:hypothetical protein
MESLTAWRHHRTRKWLTGIVTGGLALLLSFPGIPGIPGVSGIPGQAAAAPQASPLAGYQVVEKFVRVPEGGTVRDTVICPQDKVVLGGGAAVAGEGAGPFRTVLRESVPGTIGGGERSVWLASVTNNDSTGHTILFSATCADRPDGYQVEKKSVRVPAGETVRDAVRCPQGKVVLGGGTQVAGEGSGPFGTVLRESVPATDGEDDRPLWGVSVTNNDSREHTMMISATCATAPTGYEVEQRFVPVPEGGTVRDTVICPQGKVVLGGGAAVAGEGTGPFRTVLRESVPGTIGGGERSLWGVSLSNNDSTRHTILISATCARR